ncbi:formimidoylglutamate deiminase [Nocardioides cynanchi]|uniref:formimidoylglutamate deiminase n=1 Tax=Nocardioides cynanchi TaxID=2558918 RepID=UPI0012484885|nr:formimidoylglutamate deiminase [Nocardioides cynanchi]
MSDPTSYLLERAWVDGAVHDDVLVEIEDGRFSRVEVLGRDRRFSAEISAEKQRLPRSTGETSPLPGLTLPGLANCHSHAFHRALRGRTQRGSGTFWTWREQMYDVAGRLDPDSYLALAEVTFREMVAAGITTVGEFHYLHHQPDGTPYDDPNAMGRAVIEAATRAGIRLTLLDTCYLTAGIGRPPEGVQRRFSDGDVDGWGERLDSLTGDERTRIAGAYHSVRAVPRDQMRTRTASPLHIHLSEQVAENDECLAAYGLTPTQVFAEAGHLTDHNTLVHATHLTDDDVRLIGRSGAYVDFCPTTERDLGDGIGPGRALQDAGARLTLGSDSHAVIDPFEEMRALELDERLASRSRGHWTAAELLVAGTRHDSLGWDDVGRIAVGERADLVTLATDTTRTAGTGADEHTAVFAAAAEDVTQVVVDGRVVFRAADRQQLGRDLADVVGRLWS